MRGKYRRILHSGERYTDSIHSLTHTHSPSLSPPVNMKSCHQSSASFPDYHREESETFSGLRSRLTQVRTPARPGLTGRVGPKDRGSQLLDPKDRQGSVLAYPFLQWTCWTQH